MPLCLSGGRSVGHLGRYCACFASLSSFGSSSLFSADNHQKRQALWCVPIWHELLSEFQCWESQYPVLTSQTSWWKRQCFKRHIWQKWLAYSGWYLMAGLRKTKANKKPRTLFFFLQMGDFPEFNRVLEKGDSFHVCLCVGKLHLVDGEKRTPHSHTPSLREKPPTIPTQLKCPTWSTFWWNLRSEMCQLLPAVVSGAQGILGLVCSWGWMEGGLIHCKFRPDSEDLGPLCLAVIFLNYKENKSN